MDEVAGVKQSGRFKLEADREVYGQLTLAGSKSSLYLYDGQSFDAYPRPGRHVSGVLPDLTRVSLIDCVTISGTGTGSRGGEKYYFANLFPHFVLYGDRHITPDDQVIAGVEFVIDDASTLFYDFDAFGSLIDARPYIDQIARANPVDREIKTGPEPQIVYFTGKRDIFSAETVLGQISATHNPNHTVGGPTGVDLKNTISVTIAFGEPQIFEEAMARTATVNSYLGMLVGRPQNITKLHAHLVPTAARPSFLSVYWSMPPRRSASREGDKPHPGDVLLDAVRAPAEFSAVLGCWLQADRERRAARERFFGCFGDQQYYGVDRLVAAANMFDILPDSAAPAEALLSAEEKNAREAARTLFLALPPSIERNSVLSALGRMGKSSLKRKIRHRAQLLIDTADGRFPELNLVCDEAVNCRNYYVHGGNPAFDYADNAAVRTFLTDTLEFVFVTSDLIEAGWNCRKWLGRGSSMSNPFARYHVNYSSGLEHLRSLLPPRG